MTELVIWAQNVCRSTMSLYREVKRQCACPVLVVVRQSKHGEAARRIREKQGQSATAYSDVVDFVWDGKLGTGMDILKAHSGDGAVHVFSGYQVSAAVRQLICEAHVRGLKTAVYDEAPCPVCVGLKAMLKRVYYRWVLPLKVRRVTEAADLFLSASGRYCEKELIRLGWTKDKIIPFGYASEVDQVCPKDGIRVKNGRGDGPLHVLHTGIESAYRDVETLKRAMGMLDEGGVRAELRCTGGGVSTDELKQLFEWADVLVACGLCEPWGMRVNDAIHAGLPVIVSDGMGVAGLVKELGCGCVYGKGNARELADALKKMTTGDDGFWRALGSGVARAHAAYTPAARARVFLECVTAR